MKSGQRTVNTALDKLPYGDPNSPEAHGRVKTPRLPDGVTRGMLIRDVVMIAWPSLVELVLAQLTSMVDQVMVGRLPGNAGIMGLSAIGLAMQPKFLLMTMIMAMNIGSTAVIARFRGQRNQERATQVFRQALLLNAFMSALFMVLGLALSRPLIKLMSGSGISQETMDLAVQYLNIQLYDFIPMGLAFTVTAALRGIGNTRTPMIYNTVANVVNVAFNYLLIYGKLGMPALGVAGASWATVIGQTTAFVIATITVLRPSCYLHIKPKDRLSFDKNIMSDVVKIGFPSMLEQLFMRAGIIVFTRAVAGLGDTMYATHQICMSVQAMSFMLGQAFANSTTTLMGQSIGKRRYDMAEIYMRKTRNVGICVAIVAATLFIIFRKAIVGLYNSTPEVIENGAKVLILIAASQPIQADQFIVSGGLRGAGDTKYTAFVIAICVLIVRSGLAVLLVTVLKMGLWGAWIALVADQMLRTVFMAIRYDTGKWKEMVLRNDAHGPEEAKS
ncbi:MAG: MATE family efflux transporter [Oscillospiraceae bacterium]|nr:MATE family efflux transporter [Oscillospiraceae bacterium]